MTLAVPSRRTLFLGFALAALVVLAGVLSVPVAEGRALSAEEAYVADQLEDASCLGDWGANEGAATKDATVTNWTAQGVHVTVSMPYAYTTESEEGTIHADAVSEAVYLVTALDARRLSGDTIAPC